MTFISTGEKAKCTSARDNDRTEHAVIITCPVDGEHRQELSSKLHILVTITDTNKNKALVENQSVCYHGSDRRRQLVTAATMAKNEVLLGLLLYVVASQWFPGQAPRGVGRIPPYDWHGTLLRVSAPQHG